MLESKLSEDPVYIDYCKKVEEQERLKKKLKDENLEKEKRVKVKGEINQLQKDIDSICEKLRKRI